MPFPANAVIRPFDTLRTRLESTMWRSPEPLNATADGAANSALMADPLSPPDPDAPFPATVVMMPFETFRMRLFNESAM